MGSQWRTVWITDADSDSGRAILRRLAADGCRFILNSKSGGARIAAELEKLRQAGLEAAVVQIDAASSGEVNDMLRLAEPQVGTVDTLVHNNNEVLTASVESCEEDRFLQCLRANAKTAFVCTQAVGRYMATKPGGSIVYVSSIHAEKPTGSAFAYSAAKGAVKMLAKEAALVLGRHGVRVNTIELGPVKGDDEVFAGTISTLYRDYEYKVPNAVPGNSEDIAELVAFLSSDAARYVNGADIRLDGGFLLHYMNVKMKRP